MPLLRSKPGDYVGTPIEQRICKLCHQDVEDEAHFILQCHALSAERQFLLNYLQMNIPGFEYLTLEDNMSSYLRVTRQEK